jgi:hypothetical protein
VRPPSIQTYYKEREALNKQCSICKFQMIKNAPEQVNPVTPLLRPVFGP